MLQDLCTLAKRLHRLASTKLSVQELGADERVDYTKASGSASMKLVLHILGSHAPLHRTTGW